MKKEEERFEKAIVLFLMLLATTPLRLDDQVNLQMGYFITNGDDIIHGTIDYLTDARNARECLFQREAEREYKPLSPADIKGCGILTVACLFM